MSKDAQLDGDEKSVDEWWSRQIGDTQHVVKWSPVQLWFQFDDGSSYVIKDNPTHGDVRRLLAAMNLSSKYTN